jgi:hypothetical protein
MPANFLIIGAQKAATTWLADCLVEHPDVFMTRPKEIHFFNHAFDKGIAWYEAYFQDWSGQSAVGEATPGYLNHPAAPGRIKATLGDKVKLIASLRHPVDRAYSAFWHYTRRGHIPPETDFATLLLQAASGATEDRFGLCTRGLYFSQLSRYLEYFARDNLQILIYEDLKKDNEKAVRECLTFLGVDTQFVPGSLSSRSNSSRELRRFHGQAVKLRQTIAEKTTSLLAGRVPAGMQERVLQAGRFAFEHLLLRQLPKQSDYARLNQDVRQDLLESFMPDIRQLEDLLRKDLSVWYGQDVDETHDSTGRRDTALVGAVEQTVSTGA